LSQWISKQQQHWIQHASDSIINETDFETTLNMRMDAYLQSYPLKMEEAMMKFTSEYFKDNDTLEHYIREIAGSMIDISEYRDQLAQWLSRNMGEDNQSSDDESEVDTDGHRKQEKEDGEKGDEYNGYKGGRPPLFTDAHWRRTEEDRKREATDTRE
jgi:hypothetical protein